MASWRDRLRPGNGSPSSTPPSSPEPLRSEAHGRAAEFIDRFADHGLGRIFGELPGKDHLVGYLKGRARRELGKLSPETLDQYLRGLAGLMEAIRTGKDYADFTEMAEKLPQEVGAGK